MVNIVLNFVLIISITAIRWEPILPEKRIFDLQTIQQKEVYGCEQNWKSFENHCYALVDRPEPWHAAMQYCEAFRAALVMIDDLEEFIFLQDTLRAHYRVNDSRAPIIEYWTAGNDIIFEGHWVWSPSSEPMEFKPWAPGEPNQSLNGTDDCAGLYNFEDFRMNDDNCDERRFFICEKEDKSNGQIVG